MNKSNINLESIHRLEGSHDEVGGLILKKPLSEEDKHLFKAPERKSSLLGLDVLAAAKRKERELSARDEPEKRSRVSSYNDDWEDVEVDREKESKDRAEKPRYACSKTSGLKPDCDILISYLTPNLWFRHYRPVRVETPSHTGGVSDSFKQKQHTRHDRDREKGVYASSKNDKHKHSSKRHKDGDRSHRSEQKGEHSSRSSRRDWDESPRRRDEPPSPSIRPKDSPSRTNWEEDEETPLHRSAWDLPTPNSRRGSEKGDRSERR